ncbi:MAG TPA: GtrA family protein [Pontiella sp.]
MASKLGAFLKGKGSPVAQIFKYVMCGCMAVIVDQVVFYLLAWRLLPCLRATDPVARLLEWVGFAVVEASESELKRNYWVIKAICFIAANAVVYTLNVLFVFTTGRHTRFIEVLLFFGSSLFQFLFIWLGGILITQFGWEVTYSNVTMLLTSLMINFIVRKKVVFKG